jgi:hypothetical protein
MLFYKHKTPTFSILSNDSVAIKPIHGKSTSCYCDDVWKTTNFIYCNLLEKHQIGNSWIQPSKTKSADDKDADDDVVDFFFEDEQSKDDENENDSPINFDVGIDGRLMETGPLSLKMYNAINSRTSLSINTDLTTQRIIYELILKTTAKEALKVTLQQSGLQLAIDNDLDDNGWGTLESIRVYPTDQSMEQTFDSWESLLLQESDNVWAPGVPFSFVIRNVPTFRKAVSIDDLLLSLDPDGSLRDQAVSSGMIKEEMDSDDGDDDDAENKIYHPITSLKELFEDNNRRVEESPRVVEGVDTAYTGMNKGGYRIIHALDLFNMVNEINDYLDRNKTITSSMINKYKNTTMHVMDAFVSHGCLIVDLSDGDSNQSQAQVLHQMWETTESFFRDVASNSEKRNTLPSWQSVQEAGSRHAKVGYRSDPISAMLVLETRHNLTDGHILPQETKELFDTDGYSSMRRAFHMITELCQTVIQIAVGACTNEICGVNPTAAMTGAKHLVNELVDNGKQISTTSAECSNKYTVSMSPHRLLQYGPNEMTCNESGNNSEIFGAHTDTTFITAVPVASVAGLEIFDEAAQLWYRPELAVHRYHSDKENDSLPMTTLPWYTRYVVLMPGELLQLVTCNEVPAAVHRVIDGYNNNNKQVDDSAIITTSSSVRYSAPVLLRGRSGMRFDCERYFGIRTTHEKQQQSEEMTESLWPVWVECQNMTMDEIYTSLQWSP